MRKKDFNVPDGYNATQVAAAMLQAGYTVKQISRKTLIPVGFLRANGLEFCMLPVPQPLADVITIANDPKQYQIDQDNSFNYSTKEIVQALVGEDIAEFRTLCPELMTFIQTARVGDEINVCISGLYISGLYSPEHGASENTMPVKRVM